MPWRPWQRSKPQIEHPRVSGPISSSTATGDESVAAHTIYGGVRIESRTVAFAPGVVPPPDDVGVPVAGVHKLPRRPNSIFVGRGELLAEVAALFASTPTDGLSKGARAAVGQAITGLGGIGKSELALHYASGRTGPGAVVWWADAENAETLGLALADLAYRLQPKATAEEWKTPQAADWATAWLQAHTGWLLVLDNVENPDLITPVLGRLTTGDILITTRRRIPWGKHGVTPLIVELLPRPAAVQLLHDTVVASSRDLNVPPPAGLDTDAVDAIAEELGDLPLALEQAGAYIAAVQTPPADYLQRLRQETGTMLGKTAPGADPKRAVARVFALTIKALGSTAPAAVGILRALAWLAPVPLPRQVLVPSASAAAHDADELIGLLASYSLIALTPSTVAVHRLLQATVRDYERASSKHDEAAPQLTEGQATALAMLGNAIPDDPASNVAGWGLWRDLLPHLEVLFERLPDLPERSLGRLLNEAAVYVDAHGRHDRALSLRQRTLAVCKAALGPDHPDTAIATANLATTFWRLGRYTDALPLHQGALAIAEATFGPDHPNTAAPTASLAATLWQLGRPDEALALQQRALAITEAALGPNHPTTAIRLTNLAITVGALGRHTDALPLQQRALAITEATLGPNHPTTATVLTNLASTLGALGRHTDALPPKERALEITEATLGPNHPETATRLNNLATTLGELGRHTDALPLKQRALAITEATLGPHHPTTATQLNNLANTLAALGLPDETRRLRERAQAIPGLPGDRGQETSRP
jgi:tetratricopeptide (TPR) repeat protein